jgi:hypothetical protein
MKKHNPHTPIMLREASGTEPKVYARFGTLKTSDILRKLLEGQLCQFVDGIGFGKMENIYGEDVQALNANILAAEFGKEKMIPLKGLDDVAIQKQVTELVQTPI